jgi:diacylglycerol kinase (ATP)
MKIGQLFRSFSHAFRGIGIVFRREQNFRVQLVVGVGVIVLMLFFPLETWQRILLILMMAAVLVLEILNTIVEHLSDILKPRLHPSIKEVKDMMAGAVLLTSLTSVVVAILIFWNYIADLFFNVSPLL